MYSDHFQQLVKRAGDGTGKCEGDEGYCYLCLYDLEVRSAVGTILGPYPKAGEVRRLGGYDVRGSYAFGKQDGFVHLERSNGCGGAPFDRLGITDDQRLGGYRRFGLREFLLFLFLAIVFLTDYSVYSPDIVFCFVLVGMFAIRCCPESSGTRFEEFREDLVFDNQSGDGHWLIRFWRRNRSKLGYPRVVVPEIVFPVHTMVSTTGSSSTTGLVSESLDLELPLANAKTVLSTDGGVLSLVEEIVSPVPFAALDIVGIPAVPSPVSEIVEIGPSAIVARGIGSVAGEEASALAGGFPWPPVEYPSSDRIPLGLEGSVVRVAGVFRSVLTVRMIEYHLANGYKLDHFPGYTRVEAVPATGDVLSDSCSSSVGLAVPSMRFGSSQVRSRRKKISPRLGGGPNLRSSSETIDEYSNFTHKELGALLEDRGIRPPRSKADRLELLRSSKVGDGDSSSDLDDEAPLGLGGGIRGTSPIYQDNSDGYPATSPIGSAVSVSGFRRPSPVLMLSLVQACSAVGDVKGEFNYRVDCRARDSAAFPVKWLQREISSVEWNCDLGKLHVSIFPYFDSDDPLNLCFPNKWARSTLLWEAPSFQFVEAYLELICPEFESPVDVKVWKKLRTSLMKFRNPSFSEMTLGEFGAGVSDFVVTESAAALSNADWIYREIKDLGHSGAIDIYGEARVLKTTVDSAYDGLKSKGFAFTSGLIDEVLLLGDTALSVYSEAKEVGGHLASETYDATKVIAVETTSGLRDGFSDVGWKSRTRGTLNGVANFADSVFLRTVALGELGYNSIDQVMAGADYGLDRSSVWGMTLVDSFESLVGVTSRTFENLYAASPSASQSFSKAEWLLDVPSRSLGFVQTVETLSGSLPVVANNVFAVARPLLIGAEDASKLATGILGDVVKTISVPVLTGIQVPFAAVDSAFVSVFQDSGKDIRENPLDSVFQRISDFSGQAVLFEKSPWSTRFVKGGFKPEEILGLNSVVDDEERKDREKEKGEKEKSSYFG